MTLLRESFLYQLWLALVSLYENSALHRALESAGVWCSRKIDESVILEPLCREGAVAGSWESSLSCRLLTLLGNLPAQLLHGLYTALHPLPDGSFFARLAFRMGDETAIAESWLVALLWVIPFSFWNNAYTLLGFSLLLALFYTGAMHRRDFRLDAVNLGFYPVLFFGSVCLGFLLSYAPSLSMRFLLFHVSAALCVAVTVSAVESGEDLTRLAAGGGGVCVLVSSLYGVWQRIQGVEVNKSYVDLRFNAGMPGRVESFYDNPNTFAEVLLLLLPLVVALVFCSKSLFGRLAAGGVLAVGAVALGMTYSRASWVGFACAMVVFVFLWRPGLIPVFAALCVLGVPFLPDTIWNRILTIGNLEDASTASRVPLYEAALKVIRLSPVTGAGLGTDVVRAYIRDHGLYYNRAPFVHAHNFYLQIWLEAGLLGIVSFLGAMLWNIKRAARTVRHCEYSAARTLTCAAAASLCGSMVCGLADYLWNYPRVMCIFWFIFAVALSGTKLCRAGAAGEQPPGPRR